MFSLASVPVRINTAINDSKGKSHVPVSLVSQVSSGRRNSWIMRRRPTTGSRSTPWTVAWCHSPPSWRSSSRCRTSTTTRHRPQSLSTTPQSWRTPPKTCQSSRSAPLIRMPGPAIGSPTGSPAAIPRGSLPLMPEQVRLLLSLMELWNQFELPSRCSRSCLELQDGG